MTNEQSQEILNHLINELNSNGFSFVVEEVNSRLEEDFESEKFNTNLNRTLIYFINQSIEIFENNSNTGIDKIIDKLNRYSSNDKQIKEISVQLIENDDFSTINLKELPNYSELIKAMIEIRNEIIKEN